MERNIEDPTECKSFGELFGGLGGDGLIGLKLASDVVERREGGMCVGEGRKVVW